MIDRNYIFELYPLGADAVLRYIESLDCKVEDVKERVINNQTQVGGLMSAELT